MLNRIRGRAWAALASAPSSDCGARSLWPARRAQLPRSAGHRHRQGRPVRLASRRSLTPLRPSVPLWRCGFVRRMGMVSRVPGDPPCRRRAGGRPERPPGTVHQPTQGRRGRGPL